MRIIKAFIVVLLAVAGIPTALGASIAEHIVRKSVAGVDVIVYPMNVKDVVTIRGSLPAGDMYAESGNIAAATLTGMLLDKGTTRQDKFAIAKQLDDIGAQLGFGVSQEMLAIGGKTLKKDLPLVVRLLAEQLRTPAFAPDELEKARKQLEAGLRSSLDNTGSRAQEAFSRLLFPPGHPNRVHSVQEWLDANARASIQDVKTFHQKVYGPSHFTLVFVGDVDAPAIQQLVASSFAGWKGGVASVRSAPKPTVQGPRQQTIAMKDKTSVSVLLGQPTGLRYQDPDSMPLRVGTAILGSGFTGRLMSTVRDKEGLTYGIGASISDDTFVGGTFAVSATFAPVLLEKGVASTRRVLQDWYEHGVTAAELAERKTSMIGGYEVSLSNTDGMSGAILLTVERGKDLRWLDDLPKAINAVTLEQVNAAIQKYLNPTDMVLAEAGTLPGT